LRAALAALGLSLATASGAAPVPEGTMLSPDLADILRRADCSGTNASVRDGRPLASWARTQPGANNQPVTYVQVVILGRDDVDPMFWSFRINHGSETRFPPKAGPNRASAYARFISIPAISAMVAVCDLQRLGHPTDWEFSWFVRSIVPNRLTWRSQSHLEAVTGAVNQNPQQPVRSAGLDGSGVGVAVLDSGIQWNHRHFRTAAGQSRVSRAVDFTRHNIATLRGAQDWQPGVDTVGWLEVGDPQDFGDWSSPRDPGRKLVEVNVANGGRAFTDAFGHGSHVASVIAGQGGYQSPNTTGIAPGASLFDLKVLNNQGVGKLSDLLVALDWVLHHHRRLGIRVVNMSLATDSAESAHFDPLARAVRSLTAAGITVVTSAGNFGLAAGRETYGTIASPGHEPSAITVGSVNTRQTLVRAQHSINHFSSRGPTRGSAWYDSKHMPASFTVQRAYRKADNLLKPDLVAPGNRIAGARSDWSALGSLEALRVAGTAGGTDAALMQLSGTSISAPAVAGTVALMLQANPGLTPPLIKAILQYTATPLANANLMQQGAGELNVAGAVALARALRTDLAEAIAAGSIRESDSMLRPGLTMPRPETDVNGQKLPWSRIV
jgi:subtilisin family serine protease